MAIEKLLEFAKDGQKNTDDLNLTDGFSVSKKPARQWFNWLFNSLTLKINEIIENKLDKTANAVSATKLKNARKINTIDFDGSQDINIEAPLRWVGQISTLEQFNSAVLDGKYTVSGLDVAGLYGYGVLVVLRNGGLCHQIYYPHLGLPPNNATMAMRQTWNMNGDIASWSEWRVVGTRDDSKLPLAGGTLTGDLMVNGTSNFKSINATGEITIDKPEVVLKHKLSGRYLYINNEDWGVYSPQGSIPLPVGSGGTGNLEGRAPSADRLATPRNIFGQTFDGSGDVGGTITASTGLVQASAYHFIDMGRNGLDQMNFYNFGATFNFIDSQNGNVVARITHNGIDCNAASASKVINVGLSPAYENISENPPQGLTLASVYNNGYPAPFGNVLRLGGLGHGEVLIGWPGDSGVAPSFIRGKRDGNSNNWTSWREIVFVDALPSHNVGSATRLNTPRKINGVEFDGTKDINVVDDPLMYMPIPYPKASPPTGYLAMMGQAISESTYPKLYALYGAVLPDMRAYSVRGLDYGRGIDVGRTVLSQQGDAIRNITGALSTGAYNSGASGVFVDQGTAVARPDGESRAAISIGFDASRVVPTASENRVKNIAFLYIVKAG